MDRKTPGRAAYGECENASFTLRIPFSTLETSLEGRLPIGFYLQSQLSCFDKVHTVPQKGDGNEATTYIRFLFLATTLSGLGLGSKGW